MQIKLWGGDCWDCFLLVSKSGLTITATKKNQRNTSDKSRTIECQENPAIFIKREINIYKSNRIGFIPWMNMNIFSPIQRSQILANFISLHSPHSQLHTLQCESSGHQPVGHILFQLFINRPFDFTIFTLSSSSQHFLPLIVAAAAGWSTVFEFMKFEWRRQFAASIFFLRSLRIVCALIAINLYRYQPHLSAVGYLATMRRLVPTFFFSLHSIVIRYLSSNMRWPNRMLDSERHWSEHGGEQKKQRPMCVLSEKSWHSKWMHFNKVAPDQSAAIGAEQIKREETMREWERERVKGRGRKKRVT